MYLIVLFQPLKEKKEEKILYTLKFRLTRVSVESFTNYGQFFKLSPFFMTRILDSGNIIFRKSFYILDILVNRNIENTPEFGPDIIGFRNYVSVT